MTAAMPTATPTAPPPEIAVAPLPTRRSGRPWQRLRHGPTLARLAAAGLVAAATVAALVRWPAPIAPPNEPGRPPPPAGASDTPPIVASAPPTTAPQAAPVLPRDPAAASRDEGLERPVFHRSAGRAIPTPDAAAAHRAWLDGNLAAAEAAYTAALRADPAGAAAHLGLAALAIRRGREAEAIAHYRTALVADPGNPAAVAALAGLEGGDPVAVETELRRLRARRTDGAPLDFALGNLLAGQRRWPEARFAYAAAVEADPDDPDYRHNLAVALDRLGQTRLAADHYRLALAARAGRPAAFDPEPVRRRLRQLDPEADR